MTSDNGPQFACREFKTFPISPGNIQANGKVESAVKTAKRLLRKACKAGTDPYLVILHYRNTPTQGVGSSPAERLMSCRTKTLLPATNQLLQPQPSSTSEQRTKLVQQQIKQKLYHDRHAKDLQPLSKGDSTRQAISTWREGLAESGSYWSTWQTFIPLRHLTAEYTVESAYPWKERRNSRRCSNWTRTQLTLPIQRLLSLLNFVWRFYILPQLQAHLFPQKRRNVTIWKFNSN